MLNKIGNQTLGDLFSKLPDDIICRIVKCLPLRDAARLSLVSRKCLCTWKELPKLRFDAEFFADVLKGEQPGVHQFCYIMSVILLSHHGPINAFYLYVPELNSTGAPDIGPWISFLSRNNVNKITIKNAQKSPLKLPYHLFSCLSLEKLEIHYCIINFLPAFKVFRTLMSIEFERVVFVGNSCNDFISSCPLLQSLTLKNCTGFECVYVTAPSLKYLTVSGKIESVYLRCQNLIAFSITLDEMVPNFYSSRTCELMTYLAQSCPIEKLFLGGYFCKFLTAGRCAGMFPTNYRFLKALQLSNIESNDMDELCWVVGMIKSCPNVEELHISFSSVDSAEHKISIDPHYRLARLRKVKVTSVMGVSMELKLIELLLRCSPALEKLYVKRDVNITAFLESRLTRELMYFRRASAEAVVIYAEPNS